MAHWGSVEPKKKNKSAVLGVSVVCRKMDVFSNYGFLSFYNT